MKRSVRLAASAGAAFAGFVAACAMLTRTVAPAPADSVLRADWLRANGARFDTVFIGSSRTIRQVVPAMFDGTMAEAGRPTRSFNLGTAGMRAPEDAFVLERALDGRREPLQFLLVECNPVRLGIPEQDRGTMRAVYWHDGPRVRTLWGRVWAQPSLEPDRRTGLGLAARHLAEFADHLRHWAWNASRMGRAPELFEPRLRSELPASPVAGLGPNGDGYDPGRERREMNAEEIAEYEQQLADEIARGKPSHFGDTESQAELQRKRALAERFGARLVLIAPPTVGAAFAPLPGSGLLFLDFSDPDRYPELFAVEHRFDRGHLNHVGALLYSRLLARELSQALSREG